MHASHALASALSQDTVCLLHRGPSRCRCGVRLPPPKATGRPRLTCSTACRRARDFQERKLRRVEVAIALWHAERGQGRYSPTQIAEALNLLRGDVAALLVGGVALVTDTGR
jgi:hypothetical protein